MDSDDQRLMELWRQNWPGSTPEADMLRIWFPDRWVRFHSLPGSKRYAEDAFEEQIVLERHRTVLRELMGSPETGAAQELLVVTAEWEPDEHAWRAPHLGEAVPDRQLWWRFESAHSEVGMESWCSAFLSRVAARPAALDPLLRLVAEDRTRGVILAPADFRWLYHPYDGGADVLLGSPRERDALRARHDDWLSAHPGGL